jgi:CRP/FNR family cyclic AMP-dependent transcriptional regulator
VLQSTAPLDSAALASHRWLVRVAESNTMRGSALLMELDPDLLEAIPPVQQRHARLLRVPTLRLSRGTWQPPAAPASSALLALLIADGIAFHSVTAAGFTTGDLLGAGDVIAVHAPPPELPGGDAAMSAWQVIQPMTVGVLDVRFAAWATCCPTLTWRLLDRQAQHADRMMARLSLIHRQRMEERLLLVLWDLADRWGKVRPDGVHVPIPLRHHQLAALVASLRPSVTLALRRLAEGGIVERSLRGYLLHGTFDETWAQVAHEPVAASVGLRDRADRTIAVTDARRSAAERREPLTVGSVDGRSLVESA